MASQNLLNEVRGMPRLHYAISGTGISALGLCITAAGLSLLHTALNDAAGCVEENAEMFRNAVVTEQVPATGYVLVVKRGLPVITHASCRSDSLSSNSD